MSKRWVRCRVQKGMFSDELVVVIRTHGGEDEAFFVPKSEVSFDDSQAGSVRVSTYSESPWAVVPNAEQTLVAVDQSEFLAA